MAKFNSKIITGGILVGALVLSVYVVTSKFQTKVDVQASDPCSSYTKGQSVTTKDGTVKSLSDDQFTWSEDKYGVGQFTGAKVVIVCAGTQFVNKIGGNMTFKDMLVGQKVSITGWYADLTNTTILAQQVKAKFISTSPINKDSSTTKPLPR